MRSPLDEPDLYNEAPCGYHSLDARGVFISVNDTELRWLGYTREQLVGRMKLSDLVTDTCQQMLGSAFARLCAEGSVEGVELELRRKDGSHLPVLSNAAAAYDDSGQLVRQRWSLLDITRRKLAEQERDRFFELSLDMLCVAGIDGYFKRINPSFERTLGHRLRDLLDAPFIDFVHPDDRDATLAEVDKLARGEPTIAFENRYRCRDGSYKWLSWMSQPSPRDGLIFAVARDMTALRRVNDALRASEERLAVTLRSIADGVLVTDAEGRISLLNPVAEAMTQWSESDARGDAVENEPHSVLVIEDHRATRTAVERLLTRAGYRVRAVGSLDSARAAFAGDVRYAAIVCDLTLSDGSGADLLYWLRDARPDLARRVIIHTGGATDDLGRQLLAERGDGVLRKPVTPERLLEAVRRVAAGNEAKESTSP